MTSDIHSLCGHCKLAQRVDLASANIWWPLRPIWGTSTSTRHTGISKLRPTFCVTSPTTAKRSCAEECHHDADRTLHRRFLRENLSHHRGASPHTCESYAYRFQRLLDW